jgi:hypothetical protein
MNGGRTFSEMLAEIEALRAENEKLRKALKKIVKKKADFHCGPDGCYAGIVIDIASKALGREAG